MARETEEGPAAALLASGDSEAMQAYCRGQTENSPFSSFFVLDARGVTREHVLLFRDGVAQGQGVFLGGEAMRDLWPKAGAAADPMQLAPADRVVWDGVYQDPLRLPGGRRRPPGALSAAEPRRDARPGARGASKP